MNKPLFLLLLLCTPLVINAQTNTHWSPKQVMTLKNITAVRVSPDGKKAVYALREAVMTASRSEYVNQIFLTKPDKPDTAIRISRGDRDNMNPRWSKDGKFIGFISNRD